MKRQDLRPQLAARMTQLILYLHTRPERRVRASASESRSDISAEIPAQPTTLSAKSGVALNASSDLP